MHFGAKFLLGFTMHSVNRGGAAASPLESATGHDDDDSDDDDDCSCERVFSLMSVVSRTELRLTPLLGYFQVIITIICQTKTTTVSRQTSVRHVQ